MHPLCTRSRPFETVKDLKGLAVSPERAILTAVYGHGAGQILQGPPLSKPPHRCIFLRFYLTRQHKNRVVLLLAELAVISRRGYEALKSFLLRRLRFSPREEPCHSFFYGERIWFSSKVFPFVRVVFVVIELLALISITDVTVSV